MGGQIVPGYREEQLLLPLQEEFILPPIRKASSSHPQVLHQSQVFHLMSDQEIIKLPCGMNRYILVNTIRESSLTHSSIGTDMEKLNPQLPKATS